MTSEDSKKTIQEVKDFMAKLMDEIEKRNTENLALKLKIAMLEVQVSKMKEDNYYLHEQG